ncbi:probable divalent-cation tolerance protein [Crocosphaera subtropica ATCC 51142]|uniref:Probable divalent-cation tolerance protein n=1 Tax=Crocosphaera subtropica (strain ATCC 51142 / BH68) TaxID=43989 RepID=B1WZB1_CROS5|nr:divalent-cation tolerance protein CutA [Crocosphaera subtropica]ACB49477.1 probable divalent-cation tolerance protein [Crocosphaera subtropica ATCC 51142]
MSSPFTVVITTTSKKEDANQIAKTLLEKKLAGCIQILGPISSHYYWKNELCIDEEWICLIKSSQNNYQTLEKAIQDIHPYDVPEIISLPIVEGSQGYLSWLNQQLK